MTDFILKRLIRKHGAKLLIDKIISYQRECDPRDLFDGLVAKKIEEFELLSDHYRQQELDPKSLLEYVVAEMLPGYHIQKSKPNKDIKDDGIQPKTIFN
jgi:hypothetical protein